METFLYYAVNYSLTIDWRFAREMFHRAERKDSSVGCQYKDRAPQDGDEKFEDGVVFSSISTLLVGGIVIALIALARSY